MCRHWLLPRRELVSIKRLLRALLLSGALMAGALMGAVTPDEVEELMHSLNQPKITVTIPDESESGDGSIKKLTGGEP
jgi:hypothetical protein